MNLAIAPETVPIRVNGDGVAIVGDTRVPLATVLGEYNDGATPEQIVENFDTLVLADVYAVIAYYLRHREEVDAHLQAQARLAERMRVEHLRRFPQNSLREKLVQRARERAER
jgi:uncharacterized protein (DUF433 family)